MKAIDFDLITTTSKTICNSSFQSIWRKSK